MIFTELDFRLSVVKRWSVIQTLRTQSLAEHGYNVAIIALRIAENWYAVTSDKLLLSIARRALYHDYWESITGDFPTYMKRFVDEVSAVTEFESLGWGNNVDLGDNYDVVRVVVKTADYVDALIFLYMEMSLGNKTVLHHIRELERRFKVFLEENPINGVKTASAFDLYRTEIVDGMFNSNGQFQSELYGFPKP